MNLDKLVKFLEERLNEYEGKRVLITSKYIFLNKITIGLLKVLLNIKESKGIYIAIDRPYHYTSRLLEHHGVDQKNLFYLDAISMASSEKVLDRPNVEIIESPFCSTILTEAKDKLVKMSIKDGIDFIFLDNITVMLNYMDNECVFTFLGHFLLKLSKEGKTITIVVVDKESHPKTYKDALENSDVELEIAKECWT